jgi:small subunit ribosomal protein S16
LAVRIRLTRVGATKRPAYRVIAIDKRRSRDGRALEILGYYDPLTEPATVNLDTAKINAWIGKGAQPSETVAKLMRQAARPPEAAPEKPKRATRPAKPKASAKAAKADAAAESTPSVGDALPPEEAAAAAEESTAAAEESPAAAEESPAAAEESPAEAPDEPAEKPAKADA